MRRKPFEAGIEAARRGFALVMLLGALVMTAATPALAQPGEDAEPLKRTELESLVGPIALYPDDLVGIILPASTYPLEIVQAARFLDAHEQDPALEPEAHWDDSIVALLNYPEVLERLDADLDWTWRLGAAVLDDETRVLDAIQDFRARAYTAGNLYSDDKLHVEKDDGAIEIRPADPKVVYVPVYEPRRVVVVNRARVVHYHPWAYPVYYYPYPSGFSFGHSYRSGFFFGVTTSFSIGWHSHHVHVYHHAHARHPYYARRHVYTAPHFARRSVSVHIDVHDHAPVWRPGRRAGPRPVSVSRGSRVNEVRSPAPGRRVAGTERYTDRARAARAESARAPRREPAHTRARSTTREPAQARERTTTREPTRARERTTTREPAQARGNARTRTPAPARERTRSTRAPREIPRAREAGRTRGDARATSRARR